MVSFAKYSQKLLKQKGLTLKTDGAASTGSHHELEYFMYFRWPPFE